MNQFVLFPELLIMPTWVSCLVGSWHTNW